VLHQPLCRLLLLLLLRLDVQPRQRRCLKTRPHPPVVPLLVLYRTRLPAQRITDCTSPFTTAVEYSESEATKYSGPLRELPRHVGSHSVTYTIDIPAFTPAN